MVKVIYPGTFDPISYGHMDLVGRALKMFDHVTVAVATGCGKRSLFDESERFKLTQSIFRNHKNVSVMQFNGLLVDVIEDVGAVAVLRGLRAVSDFEYEFQMASINRRLNKKIETIFLTPDDRYTCLSSTMIREVAMIDPSRVGEFVCDEVLEALRFKFNSAIK